VIGEVRDETISAGTGHCSVMTVAHVIGEYLPRTQTFVYGLLKNLTGVESVVVTEQVENLDLFPFDGLRQVRARSLQARAFDKAASVVSGRRPVRERLYRETVRGAGASLMHGHFGWSAPLTLPLKRDLGLPLLTTFYGYDMSGLPKVRGWRSTFDKLFDEGDAFLVEGHHMKAGLVALGAPADKVLVQHIGVEVDRIVPRRPDAGDSADVTILVCGSFVEKKGVRYAIEAFAKAARERAGLRMLLVGDGPEKAEYLGLIHRLGVADSIRLLGYLTHDEYLGLAADAHIFMAPSVTASDGDTEGGAPTVLLEMQAAQLPVISTYHADIPEVVLDGRTGLLVPERDSDALAERILWLAEDPGKRRDMGLEGRRHIQESHDIVKQAAKLEAIYREYQG
jgi:colanic acid/amylovoran biosynthesis glycosyltransferase